LVRPHDVSAAYQLTSWHSECVCVWDKYECVLGSVWASKYIPSRVFMVFSALENIHLGGAWSINPWSFFILFSPIALTLLAYGH
jgi:hypothetical protein